MIRPLLAASLVVAFLIGPSSMPAGAANDRYPRATMLGKIVAQVDPDASLGGVQVFLRAGLDRQSGAQNGYAALMAELVAHTPVTVPGGADAKLPLRDAIVGLGANLAITIEPQDVRFYVEARPATLVVALGMLAQALAAPDFSNATVRAAKASLRSRIGDADQSPFSVVSAMLRASYYLGSGAGYSPAGTMAVVVNTGSDELRAFYAATYRQGGAAISAAGRVDDTIARAAQTLLDRLPAGDVAAVELKPKPIAEPPARIVTHRDVSLPWVGMGFAAPAPGDKDFAAMLVIQGVLGSLGRDASITTRPASLRAINAIYQYDVRPANFIVYASGDSLGATSGVRQVFATTELLSSKPLDSTVVERYRSLAVGQFVTDYVSLEDRSALVGVFARQGLDPDYANKVLEAIDAVTPEDIQRVAKTYLLKYTVALVLPRSPLSPLSPLSPFRR